MRIFDISSLLWICVMITSLTLAYLLESSYPNMRCSYGERGSLTVYCTNATSLYFKTSSYRFDHLDETLKCVNCTLTSLESGTFDISGNQLKIVDIKNSSISKIWPNAFIGLIFMEQLLLSNNPIQLIVPGAFYGIRKLKYLELENSISRLDGLVFKELHILEVLNLSKNKLQILEDRTFEGLHNLRTLDLSFNQLKSLGNNFQPLVNLRSLRLNNNDIDKINGMEFHTLTNLLALTLGSNRVRNFSINMDPGNKLRALNLGKNLLNSGSIKIGSFKDLDNLEEIDLSLNLFTEIPSKFFQGLYRLRVLNLHGNQIKEFSTGAFSGLPHLRRLNISSNHLQTAKVSGRLLLNSLHMLDLSNNRLKQFDYIDFIVRMPKLTYVNLLANNLNCETANEIKTLFMEDNIKFMISTSDSYTNCDSNPKTAKEIVKRLVGEKYEKLQSTGSEIVWIVLICVIIVLISLLFYVQFFILFRIQLPSSNFRQTSNFAPDN